MGQRRMCSVVGGSLLFWAFLRAALLVDCPIVYDSVHNRILRPLYGMESEEES
jgi:hypothetical protein